MGNTLSVCGTCNVDIINSVETLQRDIERIDVEINRIRNRLHDMNGVMNQNLLDVSLKMSDIKIQLATILVDVQHIKDKFG